MAAYDAYDSRRYYPDEYDRSGQNRYGDNNAWLRGSSHDLVMRTYEDGSEVSIEEIERDFPPLGYRRSTSRSTAPPTYRSHPDDDYYALGGRPPRRHGIGHYDDDRYSHKHAPAAGSQGTTSRKMNEEQILAAITGAALAIGGKELMDRRKAKQEGGEVRRNMLASAAIGAAGALAGYQGSEAWNKYAEKEARKKARHVPYYSRDGDYDSVSYFSDSDGPYQKEKKAGFLRNALSAAGLGSAIKAVTGKSSDARNRRGSPGSSRERHEATSKLQKAAMASLIAGATEAFRVSKEPGGWEGEKSKRVLTAAVGAAALDATQGQSKSSKMALAESVIGGLVGNRMLNGSKRNIDGDPKTGRSRSRSRAASTAGSRGGGMTGLAALATAGLGALGAKKAASAAASPRAASRSRSRPRSTLRSRRDSYDSYSRSRSYSPARNKRSRSRSVVDTARRSLAKMGLITSSEDDRARSPRGRRRYSDDDDDDDDDDYYYYYYSRSHSRSRPNYGRSRSRARSVVSARSARLNDSEEEDERRVRNLKEAKEATEKVREAKREKKEHDEWRRAVALHKKHQPREDQRVMRGDDEGTRRELQRLEALEEGMASREGSCQSRRHDRFPSRSRSRSPSRRSTRSARVEDDVDDNAKHSATDHGVRQQRPPVRYADGNPYGAASSSSQPADLQVGYDGMRLADHDDN